MSSYKRALLATALSVLAIALLLVLRNLGSDERLEQRTVGADKHYTGSWYFPRGGPYVLGFESTAPARLFVDEKLVASGQGQTLERVVFQAGSYPVRVETAGDYRLLWHPPGRRGPPEYVPASSLSAKSEAAVFESPGRSIADGCYALAILAVLLALAVFLARPRVSDIDRKQLFATCGVFAVALLIRLIGLNDAGQTWDEDVNWSAGRNYISNILSLDFSESSWRWNYEHPPVMKYLAGIGAQFSDSYTVSRAISAVLVSLACALLVPIGKRLYNLRVGALAAALAAFTPHVIGHSMVVGHEAPTMFFWTLAIWLSLRAHEPSPDPFRLHKRFAVLGLVIGLAVFSRYINGLLAPLVGVILLVQAPPDQRVKTLRLGISIIPLVAVITCFLVWPRMWSDAFVHLEESWAKLKKPHGLEPYLGQMTNRPGASYFFVYLWATAPLGLLVAAKLWIARAAFLRERSSLVVAAWLLAPMIVVLSPVRQDGVRYIMPALLAMNLAAAAGVDFTVGLVARYWSRAKSKYLMPAVSALLLVYMVIVCTRIHPFYLDYYGEQVGGPQSVARHKKFEIAWWGEGMNRALRYLNTHAAPGARVYKRCFEPGHLAWMRGDLWASEVQKPDQAEWLLVYQPSARPCALPKDARLVFEATAMGAPLARVYRRTLR